MALTFKGGLHPEENKIRAKLPVEVMPEPHIISVSMSQHQGSACTHCVKRGERVLKGQIIGRNTKGVDCPVHSSISGTVAGVVNRVAPSGEKAVHVIIENDYKSEYSPDIKVREKSLYEASFEEIIETIKNAGISGVKEDSIPAYYKILSAKGKASKLIVNCLESEPYITVNHRLVLEKPEEIIRGARVVMHALGLHRCDVAIESDKVNAVHVLENFLSKDEEIFVKVIENKYPQSGERQLIYALDNIEIPLNKHPFDAGIIVLNAETCAAIYKAFYLGIPLIHKTITVDGDCIANPKNVLVPIGTSISDVIEYCAGYTDEVDKIVIGGPLTGIAQWDESAPISKDSDAILCFKKNLKKEERESCIHCGKCVSSCPMHLMPLYFAYFAKLGDWESCREFDVESCIECGCCGYQCPGNVPTLHYIKSAKSKLNR